MINIVAKHFVKRDELDNFITLAKELVSETQKKDAGCIHYDLFQDLKDPQILTIIEEWENEDVLNKHMEAKHFKDIIPKLGGFFEKPPEVNFYQIVK
jgi:quinol monooxygenase YgiN